MSPEAQLSYQKPNVLLPYALLWHGVSSLCTFSVNYLLWELRFKSLTNMFVCWTAEMTQLGCSPPISIHFSWRWRPHGSGVARIDGAEPHTLETLHMEPNRLPATDQLSFIQKAFFKKKISIWLLYCCIFTLQSVCCMFLLFFIKVPWFHFQSYEMQICWPLEWNSLNFFFTW